MRVPFLDLQAHHAPLRAEIDRAIARVIDAGAFAGGPFVADFEREFAAYCSCKYAIGAEYKGRKAGTLGDAGCFSFYPGKNLGAFGEAGGVVTNNARINEKIRALRDHGQVRKYHHSMIGWNCRMDGIQGAVLQIKLR